MDESKTRGDILCPSCGRPMRLASVRRAATAPALRIYECKGCGVVFTLALDSDGGGQESSPASGDCGLAEQRCESADG